MEETEMLVRVTDQLTGEITDVEIKSADQAKNLYLKLAATESSIKKAKENLKFYLDSFLGNDDLYKFADGRNVRRVVRTSLIYRQEVVREQLEANLDKDTFAAAWESITKIDQKLAEELIIEMQDRGELPSSTLKTIRDLADMKATKPFIEVK